MKVLLIFDDEVASYPAQQICENNSIPYKKVEIQDDDNIIITEDTNADVLVSKMVDYEMKYKII